MQQILDSHPLRSSSSQNLQMRAPAPSSFIRVGDGNVDEEVEEEEKANDDVTGQFREALEPIIVPLPRRSASIRAMPLRPGILILFKPCGIS